MPTVVTAMVTTVTMMVTTTMIVNELIGYEKMVAMTTMSMIRS